MTQVVLNPGAGPIAGLATLDVCDACLAARAKQEIKSVGHLSPKHCDDCGRLVTERDVKTNWQTFRVHRIYDTPKPR